ncbi:hypothetical protein GGF41_004140 [Coemansia sp. RSA 2531]|nr:hypothetical protein GGF41_004140 [Coemansia sp. RSA 2531]
MLLSGSDDQTCRLWDTRSGKTVRCIRGFTDEITAVTFAGEHNFVAASGSNIYVYDQRALEVVSQGPEAAVCRFANIDDGEVQALSARGDFVAFVDDNGRLGVCDITDDPLASAPVHFAGGHGALAGCVCIHPELPVIASGGFDCQVLLWDMASETTTGSFVADSSDMCDETRRQMFNPPFAYALDFAPEHGLQLVSVRFVSARPEILATASLDCTLALWDAESILYPDVKKSSGATVVVGDKPNLLAQVELSAKPDTLVSSETIPVIYTDQGCDIVAYTIS